MSLRWWSALWVALLVSRPAGAIPYEVFIEVDTEDDLYDLLATQQISERSFDALLFLFQTRVDLNSADREALYQLPNLEYADVDRLLAYRQAEGPIVSLDALVSAAVLPARLVHSMAAFVIVDRRDGAEAPPTGFVRLQARWSGRYDRLPPPAALQARVRAASHLDSGAVLTITRNTLGRARWDAGRDGLSVRAEKPRLVLPKAYVEWDTPTWELVAGTYRIGFGQRLTFDVTAQVTPNGAYGDYELRRANDLTLRCKRSAGELEQSPCPASPAHRVTPDFAWTNRLLGAAVGLERAPVGPGWLQTYVWASAQPHRVQSRDVVVRSRCPDPSLDEPSCAAPRVFVRGGPSGLQSAASYASVSMAAVEPLAGLNVGYFWHARANLMITAYGATTRWLIRGPALDYQEIARKPFGGPFGAVGLSGAYGAGRHDLFVEVARSFDRQTGGGGGVGFIARSVTRLRDGELELSLRAYGPAFANPYARPVSAPDELDGLRARDETGVRARFVQRPHARLALRSLVDVWRRFQTSGVGVLGFLRADAELGTAWLVSVWAEYRSAGKRMLAATRVAFDSGREWTVAVQLQHRTHRDGPSPGQRDFAAIFGLSGRPVALFGLRVRFRYDLEDAFDNHRLPHTAWLYVESSFRVRRRDDINVRYDFRAFLDERESTAARLPSPEHWLWLEYVVRYGANASGRKERF